jgi:TPR repeat protein
LAGKNGEESSTNKLLELIRSGDEVALSEILEIASFDCKNDYYVKLIEEGAAEKNHSTVCTLGMMYYRAIGVAQDIGKGRDIIKEVRPGLKKMAKDGHLMAQYLIGWMGLEYDQ